MPDVKQPADHKPKKANAQKAEVEDAPVSFEWDGETWQVIPSKASGLEFLAALEDADSGEDVGGMIRAMRLLLGREQAARLFKGREVGAIREFFEAAWEAMGSGNR